MEFQFVMKEFSRMCKWCLDNCKPNPIYDDDYITCLEDWFDDEESIKKINVILDRLDEDEDVQKVYHNWDE